MIRGAHVKKLGGGGPTSSKMILLRHNAAEAQTYISIAIIFTILAIKEVHAALGKKFWEVMSGKIANDLGMSRGMLPRKNF